MTRIAPSTPLRQKRKPVRDKEHLAFIHLLPCCLTGLEGFTEAHHLLRVPTEERGAALKSGDNWCLPIQAGLHHNLHNGPWSEQTYLASYGIYGPGLAALLYQLSGDEQACRRAIAEARHERD